MRAPGPAVLLVLSVVVLTAAIVWRWGPEPTGGAIRIPELSAEAQAGKRAFDLSCARCHGENAGGRAAGPPLVHQTYQAAHHADVAFELAVRPRGILRRRWTATAAESCAPVGRTVRVSPRAGAARSAPRSGGGS